MRVRLLVTTDLAALIGGPVSTATGPGSLTSPLATRLSSAWWYASVDSPPWLEFGAVADNPSWHPPVAST